MKALLDDLEALLVKHKVIIATDIDYGRLVLVHPNHATNEQHLLSENGILTLEDIQRFKRELESK